MPTASGVDQVELYKSNVRTRRFWTICLAVMVIGTLWFFRAVEGFDTPFFQVADQDVVLLLDAITMNDGVAQTYLDHPGFLTTYVLRHWLRFTQVLGVNQVASLNELETLPWRVGALNELAVAGRMLGLLWCIALAAVFFLLVYVLSHDVFWSMVAAYLFAVGQGMFVQSLAIRTEPICAIFTILAFVCGIKAARARGWSMTVWMFVLGVCSYLAMINKVQAALILVFLPFFCLLFAEPLRGGLTGAWPRRAWYLLAAAVGVSVLMLPPFYEAFLALPLKSRVGVGAFYFTWISLSLVAFGIFARRGYDEVAWAGCALLLGILCAFSINFLNYHPGVHERVLLFPVHIVGFCDAGDCHKAGLESLYNWKSFMMLQPLADKFNADHLNRIPTNYLLWVSVALTSILALQRNFVAVRRACGVLIVALSVEAISKLRYTVPELPSYVCYYGIFIEPFLILSTILAMQEVLSLSRWESALQRVIPACAILFGLYCNSVFFNIYTYDAFLGLAMHQEAHKMCGFLDYNLRAKQVLEASRPCPDFITADPHGVMYTENEKTGLMVRPML